MNRTQLDCGVVVAVVVGESLECSIICKGRREHDENKTLAKMEIRINLVYDKIVKFEQLLRDLLLLPIDDDDAGDGAFRCAYGRRDQFGDQIPQSGGHCTLCIKTRPASISMLYIRRPIFLLQLSLYRYLRNTAHVLEVNAKKKFKGFPVH